MTLMEHVEMARRKAEVYGDRGISWHFHNCMNEFDRAALDRHLVAIQHPLAYQPGTQEHRFTAFVKGH